MGSKLTRNKIEKLLYSQTVGNFSSLSLGKKSSSSNNQVIKDTSNNTEAGINSNSSSTSVSNPLVDVNSNKDQSVSDPLAGVGLISITAGASEKNKLNAHNIAKDLGLKEEFFNNNTSKIASFQSDFINDPFDGRSVSDPLSIKDRRLDINTFTEETDRKIVFESVQVLAGKGFVLVMYLIDLCQKNCCLVTPPVFTKDLMQIICVKPNHLRNLILRLCEKKIFKVLLHKSSKHAVRIFEFKKNTYDYVIKRKHNGTSNKHDNTLTSSDNMNLIYSGDHVDKKTKMFKDLDLLPLENIGFNDAHIIQIHKEYEKNPDKILSVEIIQQSINSFAFDLKYNNIAKEFRGSPAVVLLSLLKRGIPYSSKTPEKFLSPQEEGMKEYLLAQEQKKIKTLEMETKTKNFTLQEWLDALPEEELLEFNKNHLQLDGMSDRVYQTLQRKKALELAKEYFDTILWPQKRSQILNDQKAQ